MPSLHKISHPLALGLPGEVTNCSPFGSLYPDFCAGWEQPYCLEPQLPLITQARQARKASALENLPADSTCSTAAWRHKSKLSSISAGRGDKSISLTVFFKDFLCFNIYLFGCIIYSAACEIFCFGARAQ